MAIARLQSVTPEHRNVLVPEILVRRGRPEREPECQFTFQGLEIRRDLEESDAADRPVTTDDREVTFFDRNDAEVHRRDLVTMSIQLEGRMFEFRPKVDCEAEPRSLDLEQVPIVVVSNAP